MMDVIYTTTGGAWFRDSLNAIAAFTASNNWGLLLSMATTLSVGAAAIAYITTHDLKVVMRWFITFALVTAILIGIKRPVQVIDLSDATKVYRVDNVPLGLVLPASLISSVGHSLVVAYETVFHQPDALTYSKTGMLFGATLVGSSTDFMSADPTSAGLFNDYVQNCTIGDIYLNRKFSLDDLMNSEDPYNLLFSKPSPLRGVYDRYGNFQTCLWAAQQLRSAMTLESSPSGKTRRYYVNKLFGNRPNPDALFAAMMGDSYHYFYGSSQNASEIIRHNVTLNGIRMGINSYAARNGDTASLVNLSTETSFMKLRLAQGSGAAIATKTLPYMQTILFGMLIGVFPFIILMATLSILSQGVLKGYVFALMYLQTWPLLFAVLNNAMNFYLKETKTGFNVVLSNVSQLQQQHSDIATTAGWLALSIPVLAYGIVKGLGSAASQAGGMIGSAIQGTTTQSASQTADGTWAFNNMQTDNVTGGKWDTNSTYSSGHMTTQRASGAMVTQTADGNSVYNTAPAMSKLPVDINFGRAQSSTAQRLARESETEAQSSLAGYNHAVNSAYNQAKQFSSQQGNSSSLTTGADSSESATQSQGVNQMLSAAKSYAERNHVSEQQAFNTLMDKTYRSDFQTGLRGSAGIDTDRSVLGKIAGLTIGASGKAEWHGGNNWSWANGDASNVSEGQTQGQDHASDRSSQEARDFRQGMDMVQSYRTSHSGSQTDNAANTLLEQFGTTLSVADSQYQQYTTSLTRSHEYSQMASTSETTSANLNSNYAQEFVGYVQSHAPERAETILTDTASPTARAEREQLAGQFMEETLRMRVEARFEHDKANLTEGMSTLDQSSSPDNVAAQGNAAIMAQAQQAGISTDTPEEVNKIINENRQHISAENASINASRDGIMSDREKLQAGYTDATKQFNDNRAEASKEVAEGALKTTVKNKWNDTFGWGRD